MYNTVLITTSGIGSRLYSLTRFTNKALVRVGAKAAISTIIETYPKDTRFVVTLGYFGDLVQQYLKLAHPETTVDFVDVSPYTGPGSSLVYSMSCAAHLLQCPFIFHCCDSLVQLPEIPDTNWVGFNTTYGKAHSGNYRMVTVAGGDLTKVNEKGEEGDGAYIGVTGIHDYQAFWATATEMLRSSDQELSDANVVLQMIKRGARFVGVKVATWLDTGNLGSLEDARKNIWGEAPTLLEKEDQAVYLLNDRVVKFFSVPEMVTARVSRAKALSDVVPPLLGSTNNFFSYRRFDGDTLTHHVTPTTFRKLLSWCSERLWRDRLPVKNCVMFCKDFYLTKTAKRLGLAYEKLGIQDTPLVINGESTRSDRELLTRLEEHPLLYCGVFSPHCHGDLHNANILYDGEEFKLIDWREGFGTSSDVGDVYYDLAKLNHGLIVSHDIVEAGEFTVMDVPRIEVDIRRKHSLVECQEILRDFVVTHGYSWPRVQLITALIYLNISALHHSPYDKFLYYFGRVLLNREVP